MALSLLALLVRDPGSGAVQRLLLWPLAPLSVMAWCILTDRLAAHATLDLAALSAAAEPLSAAEELTLELVFGVTERSARRLVALDPALLAALAEPSPLELAERLGVSGPEALELFWSVARKLELPL